MTHKSRYR